MNPLIPEVHSDLQRQVRANIARRRRVRRRFAAFFGASGSIIVTSTALAALGVWTPTLGGGDGGGPRSSERALPSGFSTQLGVLRRTQLESDRSQAAVDALATLSSGGMDGVQVAGVRLLEQHPGGAALAIPVDRTGPAPKALSALDKANQLCVLFTHPSKVSAAENCGDAATLATRGINGWLPGDHTTDGVTVVSGLDQAYVYGLVPDQVSLVRVRLEDGTSLSGPVDQNFYQFTTRSSAAPASIQWVGKRGEVISETTP